MKKLENFEKFVWSKFIGQNFRFFKVKIGQNFRFLGQIFSIVKTCPSHHNKRNEMKKPRVKKVKRVVAALPVQRCRCSYQHQLFNEDLEEVASGLIGL